MLSDYSPGRIASLACALEVTAAKPGNVHRGADFEDVTFVDFIASAIGLGQSIDAGIEQRLGRLILQATLDTRALTGTNTNLGMILLLCPLAKAYALKPTTSPSQEWSLADGLSRILGSLDSADAADVYAAIRSANPGGLGESPEADVFGASPDDLLAAMKQAQDRDLIARQFSNGFQETLEVAAPLLVDASRRFEHLTDAIVLAHVQLMAQFPDSLIARKCGLQTARQSAIMAGRAVASFDSSVHSDSNREKFWAHIGDLDFWLRCDGHRRNPGTTADMIAAGLFVALANGDIQPPFSSRTP